MDNTSKQHPRQKKSEKLSSAELKAFRQYIFSFETQFDATLDFGFSRITINNILLRGSGKPSTVEVIRQKIQAFVK